MALDYLTLRSSATTTSNVRVISCSTLTGSSLVGSSLGQFPTALSVSTLTGSSFTGNSLTTGSIGVSTLTGSSFTGNSVTTGSLGVSTLTGSSFTGNSVTTGSLGVSTLAGSTLTSNTITTGGVGFSTLTGSTLRSNTITTGAVGFSTLTGSSITTNVVSTISLQLNSTVIALGQSTLSTQTNFSNGSYVSGSWVTAKTGLTSAKKVATSSTGQYQIVVSGGTSDLWLSSDSGVTWTALTTASCGLPTLTGSAYWSSGSISADGRNILLAIYGGSLWMSQDYGRTFALTSQTTPDIWAPLNGALTDLMGGAAFTQTGSPGYVTMSRPGYSEQAVNLANTAGATATQYLRRAWSGSINFAVSFWFLPQTVNGTNQYIFSSYNANIGVYLMPSNVLAYQLPTGGGTSYTIIQTTTTILSNTWYYTTIIFQTNGTCSLYLNNNLIGSITNTQGFGSFTSSGFIGLGTLDSGTTLAFNGYISDFRLYNSAITYVPIPLLAPNIWMPFENSLADLGSNAITASPTGSITYVPGIVGLNALNLVNTAGGTALNYVQGTWTPPSTFTITMWFNVQSYAASNNQFIVASTLNNGEFILYIDVITRNLSIQLGGTQVSFSGGLSLNTWYYFHLSILSNTTATAYLNNTLLNITYSPGSTTPSNFTLGTLNSTPGAFAFNGYIDDFRIYNSVIPYHILAPQNYRSVAVSGNGIYALASAASGWVVGSSDSAKTWSKQSVSIGTQGDIIQPNKTGLASVRWEKDGVNYVATVSSTYNGDPLMKSLIFDMDRTTGWASNQSYNADGTYPGGTFTTIQGGIGNIYGEWIQLQTSISLISQSYTFASNAAGRFPQIYYIVGSNDGTNWYPIQYMSMITNPFTSNQTLATSNLLINFSGIQRIQGDITGSGTSTSYVTSTTPFTYFRFIANKLFPTDGYFGLNELYFNFSRPSPNNLALSYSGQYQLVATGSAAGSIMPNQTGLASNTWSQGGVTWGSSASSFYNSDLAPYKAFNNNTSLNNGWASPNSTYNTTTGAYTGSVSTTILGGIGAQTGEWLQIQTSVPLVLQSYTFSIVDIVSRIPKVFYIVGSTDGSNWYPLQYASMTTNPFTTAYSTATTYLTINTTGSQILTAGASATVTTTSYSTSILPYMYFRIISNSIFPSNDGLTQIGEWYLNFSNSVSYSSNYGSTWLNTSNQVSNEIVALSPSGQYALSTNAIAPFARLTLDNTNVDAQGILVPATGLGTVTYPGTQYKVGTNAAYFNQTPSAIPTMYLNYTVPAVLNTPSAFTMACWVYPTTLSGNSTPIILNNGPSSGTYANEFYIGPTGQVNVYWSTTVNSSGSLLSSSTYISANTWSHLALTFLSGIITVYVNGASVATVNAGGLLCAIGGGSLTNLIIGAAGNGGGAWAGYIDDVRIYTTALNAHEIAALYNNPAITQSVGVSSSYLPITGYTKPILPSATANVVGSAVSQTGQYMVAVTAGSSNNVYYSTDFGATFNALSIGSSPMVACSISNDGSYLTVTNTAGAVYTLNKNSSGYTLAIGNQAGAVNQASNAIAIGNQAGAVNQSANSIVLNASGSSLNTGASGFYVAPVQASNASATNSLALLGYGEDKQVVQSGLTIYPNGSGFSGYIGIGINNPYSRITLANPSYPGINNICIEAGTTSDGNNAGYSAFCFNGYHSSGEQRINKSKSRWRWWVDQRSTEDYMIWDIYRPDNTADIIVKFTSTGNVGIGTANPASALHVATTISVGWPVLGAST